MVRWHGLAPVHALYKFSKTLRYRVSVDLHNLQIRSSFVQQIGHIRQHILTISTGRLEIALPQASLVLARLCPLSRVVTSVALSTRSHRLPSPSASHSAMGQVDRRSSDQCIDLPK
jgi:hypothetical protein